MPSYQRPGVFIEEKLNPLAPSVGSTSSTVAAFIGANNRGPEAVTLVTSWNDYASKYGTWNTLPASPGGDNKLAIAVKLFFDNGGSACYIKRVTAGSPAAATRTLTDGAVSPATPANIATISAVNAGDWGENIFVSVSTSAVSGRKDVQISYPDATTVVESFTDLTFTDETDARYAINFINTRSKYVTVASVAKTAQPGNTSSPAALASGSDGTVPTASNIVSAVTAFDTVFNSLLLNAPGITVAANVNSLLSYAAARQDVFVIIDPVTGDVDTQLTLADTGYTKSSFGAVYYPNVTIGDPTVNTRGATRTASPSGAVMGLYATTDASRGVFKAPAGTSSRLADVVAVTALTNAELDLMNSASAPVNPIKYVAGSGFVVMGARTLKPGYVDRYIPVRRSLIYLRKALTDLTQYAIFEPNDAVLWRSLNATVSAFLTDFWSQGGLRGDVPEDAFFVKCDEELNTLAVIDEGQVLLEIGVALQRPAEFVIIKIGQFDGGATVTVTA
jgi:phage tail sheath protein FI